MARNGAEIDIRLSGTDADGVTRTADFRLANNPELPRTSETLPVQKDQFDTETDPGEQSLTGWWRRSQDSFHEGAGNLYQEGRTSALDAVNGFYSSRGVDVFTRGEVTLLRKLQQNTAGGTGFSKLRAAGEWATALKGGDLYLLTFLGDAPALVFNHADFLSDGLRVGGAYYGVTSTATPALVTSGGASWPLSSSATTTNLMAWGLHRPWVFGGRVIWQPDTSTASGTAQTPLYTSPSTGFAYTCAAAGPAAMYFGGSDEQGSVIQEITLDSAAAVPTLTGARVVAALPPGEEVQALAVLAGQYLGIATSRGFRVGLIDGQSITYGPLMLDQFEGCIAVTVQDSSFIVVLDATAGDEDGYTWRVDTSLPVGDGMFATSEWIGGPATGLRLTGVVSTERGLLAPDSSGNLHYAYHADGYEVVSSGWLKTGRIRYRMMEPKHFKYVEIFSDALPGTARIDVTVTGTDGATAAGSHDVDGASDSGPLPIDLGAQRWVDLTLTLHRNSADTDAGPVLRSYLVKATPAVAPQRLFTLPLLCFDNETGASGQRHHKTGSAISRLDALQALEDSGDVLTLTDYTHPAERTYAVTIEGIRFIESANPPPGSAGRGGILLLELRTAEA